MSRCDFDLDLDLWSLDHLLYITCHVIKVRTKFELNRAIPGWVIDNFLNFCTPYIMLWPWPLTSWSWTFTVLRVSCVYTLYKLWAKSNNPRLSYWRFSTFGIRIRTEWIAGGGQFWFWPEVNFNNFATSAILCRIILPNFSAICQRTAELLTIYHVFAVQF